MEYLKEYDVENYEESLVRAEELGLKEDFEEGKVLICCGGKHEFPDAFPKNKFVYNLSINLSTKLGMF